MPTELRKILGKQYFRATFDKTTINKDARTIDVVFATERQVLMSNWDMGLFYEVLPCNTTNGNLDRLNNGAPLCDTHDTSSVRNGLGVVVRAWFDGDKARATVRFSKREDVESVWQDVQDGCITGVSVGYIVSEYEQIGEKDNIPLVRCNQWEATEISLALVQADIDSGVGRSQESKIESEVRFISNNSNSNNNTMTEAEKKAALAAERKRISEINSAVRAAKLTEEFAQELIDSEKPIEECRTLISAKQQAIPSSSPVNEEEIRTNATRAERERISGIETACRIANVPTEFGRKLIEDGVNLSEARAKIIDEAAAKQPNISGAQSGIKVGVDEKEKKSRAMENSILERANTIKLEATDNPGEYRGMTLMDLAKECLTNAGINYRGLNQTQIASRALQMMTRDGGAGLGIGDFGYILQNVLNKTLRQMYDLQSRTFSGWMRKSTATDFKNMLRTQLNDVKLDSVLVGGEYKFANPGDSGETYKVAKYGKIVNIDWEAIINDDMNAFSRVPTLLSGAVAQMQGDLAYNILTAAQLMFDGNQLFDATNHANYTATGTAISIASLSVGRQQMRQQKSPGGNFLNIYPKYLVVGPQQEAAALQFTSVNYVATQGSNINIWAGKLEVIVDARITDKSWFLIADPMLIDTSEYATLDGQEIFSETRYGFEVDALQYKVRSVFGAKAIEWRSHYKNAGA